MNVLEKIKLTVGILPVLIDAIKTVENAIPLSGKGKEKLDLVKSIIQTSFDTTNQTLVTFQEIWPQIETIITKFVSIFNSAGIFKK